MTSKTTYMNLVLPTVSTARSYGTSAQDWACYINQNFFKMDQHAHTGGDDGVQIPSNALVSSGLNINSFTLSDVDYINFYDQTLNNYLPCSLYVYGGELYYYNSSSVSVQITSGGSLPVDQTSGFFGDYGDDGSRASFFGGASQFVFYGADSASFANVECQAFTDITTATISDYTGYLLGTGTGVFSNCSGYAPLLGGGWQKWYAETTNTTITYPYFSKRDDNGGVGLNPPEYTVKYADEGNYFFGYKGIGFNESYESTNIPQKTYISCKVHAEFDLNTDPTVDTSTNTATLSFTLYESTSIPNSISDTGVFFRSIIFYYSSTATDSNGDSIAVVAGDITTLIKGAPSYNLYETQNSGNKKRVVNFFFTPAVSGTSYSDYPSSKFKCVRADGTILYLEATGYYYSLLRNNL